ncbi:MAG: hypothetical protein JWO10_871 [Microbacteriaceae bacterium]|nr:hypothetical protein [Microbacteriaceae bacterium]
MAQEKWLIDSPKVIDLENIRNLKVSLIGGQVNIVGHDEPGARVEIHSVRGKSIKVSVEGDTLEIDHPQLSWDNFIEVFRSFTGRAHADISIMVPRDVHLKFGVVSASALITGLKDDARISTVSGDLVVDDMEGNIELNSVSGEIGVRAHHGRVAVHTVSGDVTASGAIERFTADGVSGTVFLDVTGVPDEIRVNTVSGSVTARLESGVAAQYRISTVSGRIQLDEAHITGVHGQYTGRYGELDKHWLDFRVNTVSGGISVLHAVTA